MKKSIKFIFILLCFIIVFLCVNFIISNKSYAWSTNNLIISNLITEEGKLKSMELRFSVPDYFAETTSWVGLQTKQFEGEHGNSYGDLTNLGTSVNIY